MSTLAADASIEGRIRTFALISLFLALFMELLDATIVNVALPSIEKSLHASGGEQQWMVAAYTLALAVTLMTGARLGDIYGRKRLFVIGLTGFTLCSALCGLAQNPEMLIASRALQGCASAMMIPQVLSSIQVMYKPTERGAAMASFSALAGVAAVSGPILGALLTEADLFDWGWRTIFLVNIPVGIFSVIAATRLVPESYAPKKPQLDFVGMGVLAVGLVAILYPLIMGREKGWPGWIFAMMAAGVVILALFVWIQYREERHDGEPLVVLSLFRTRSYTAGLIMVLVFFLAMNGYFLVQTLFMQLGLGYSVLRAGLTMIPFSISISFVAGLSGAKLVNVFGRKLLQLGPLVMGLGFVIMVLTISISGAGTNSWQWIPGIVVAGAGMGMVVAPIGVFILSEVPVRQAGPASGLFNTTQQFAGALGVAVIGTVFFNQLEDLFKQGKSNATSYIGSYELALWVMAGFMVVAAIAAGFLPAHPTLDDDAVLAH